MDARPSPRFVHAIVAALAGCAVTLPGVPANGASFAQQLPPAAESMQALAGASVADLEKAFWACDYRATTHGVHATPVEICAMATAELKRVKFGGSFEELLVWWRLNKIAEHRALEESGLEPPWAP